MHVHPLAVRLAHWVNVFALTCMVMSGWGIYNATPILPFRFPAWLTLGGWLGGSVAWHFAAMWLLVANGLFYTIYGLASGHFRKHFWPLRGRDILGDALLALRGRLSHDTGTYNAVQRLFYVFVLLMGVLVVASGLAIWKPVQFFALTELFGGFDTARLIHFMAMSGIVGFVAVHLVMVVLVPRCLLPMVTGRAHRLKTTS